MQELHSPHSNITHLLSFIEVFKGSENSVRYLKLQAKTVFIDLIE